MQFTSEKSCGQRSALEDGGQAEPPQRELEDQEIRPEELLLLGGDIRSEGLGFSRFGLLDPILEEVRVGQRREVVPPADWVEVHGIQVGNLDGVTFLGQSPNGDISHGTVE